jgi:cell volume regulation protein A
MVLDAIAIIILFGITIALGYIGMLIFRKTSIPDIIWLLLFGVLVASFGLIDRQMFVTASPLLAALALLIILFDAGLNMDFYQMVHGIKRGALLSVVGFGFSMIAVAITSMQLLGFDMFQGLLLGAMLGGTSSAIVISIVSYLRVEKRTKTVLTLESIITDPLCIVFAIAVINIILQSTSYSALSAVRNIASSFSIGAVVGGIAGIIWLRLLDKLQGKPFDYMLTLAVVFLVYAGSEMAGGSGAIASLLFGVVLGNGQNFSVMLKMRKQYTIDPELKTFQSEISFFIRSFFFVYLGVIVMISPQYLIYGMIIAAILIIVRFAATFLSTARMGILRKEKLIMSSMAPRGLAAAVLAQLPISFGLPGAEVYSSIIFVVIFATVIYTVIAVKIFSRKSEEERKKEKTEQHIAKEMSSLRKAAKGELKKNRAHK